MVSTYMEGVRGPAMGLDVKKNAHPPPTSLQFLLIASSLVWYLRLEKEMKRLLRWLTFFQQKVEYAYIVGSLSNSTADN